jgi:hypothetical protein
VAAIALEASEAYLVAGVAIDVGVALDHPTQDNWVTVGGDALAVAGGYVVGKVVVGPLLGALGSKLAQQEIQQATTEAEEVLVAQRAAAAQQAASAKTAREMAEREAELLRRFKAKEVRRPLRFRQANSHQEAKINKLRKEFKIKKDQNIAYTEGTINGKPHDVVAHSGHLRDAENTVQHTPVEAQQLQTHPTKGDYAQASRRGEAVNPSRRAHDSEAKILEDLLRKTTPESTGDIKLVSELPVCESCDGALQQFQQLRPKIRVRVWHAVK